MNVRLAAQVLSTTVSNILSNHGPTDAAATAEFCLMFDNFFDIMNVSSTTASSRELKPFNTPYLSTDNPLFSGLKNQFLKNFKDLLRSIKKRLGAYTKSERQKMFIPSQTYEGLKITVNSVVEFGKVLILIMHKAAYVLTERFCQDPLENYFSKQRSSGARKDNPSLYNFGYNDNKDNSSIYDFGYNDNTIRNQKEFQPAILSFILIRHNLS